jgi:uncharacterized lipoprotein YmbA
MTRVLCRRDVAILLLVAMLFAPGCAETQPANFYTLSSLQGGDGAAGSGGRGPAIGVGPITLPKYVDRPQIVTRSSPNRLELAEFHKWAEPLRDIFSRIVANNLATLMTTDQVITLPRRRSVPIDYQVEIDVTQFDTSVTGNTVLAARWTLFGKDGKKPLLMQESKISSAAANPKDYESVVAAMSRAVEALSREIAQAIRRRSSR